MSSRFAVWGEIVEREARRVRCGLMRAVLSFAVTACDRSTALRHQQSHASQLLEKRQGKCTYGISILLISSKDIGICYAILDILLKQRSFHSNLLSPQTLEENLCFGKFTAISNGIKDLTVVWTSLF
ncbi:hypothetical protein TNCV_879801 [Trichonephila clavipes]|nr:hypothetical protein TNCV_879801 [Trichonephila clavipes]